MNEEKKCSICGELKDLEEFYQGRNPCKACKKKTRRKANPNKTRVRNKSYYENNATDIKARVKAYQKANTEAIKEQRKVWSRANPEKTRAQVARRRAKLLGVENTLTSEEWNEVWEEHEGLCFWCRAVATAMDHIVPLTPRPGTPQGHHVKGNVVPACMPCNSRKKNKDPLMFLFEIRNGGSQ